jgi:hypothetical protein
MAEMDPSERKQRNRTLGWIALGIFALIIVVLAVIYLCGRGAPLPITVYYEGNPDINDNAVVLFRKEVVGKIDSIRAGLHCLQLVVRRYGDEDWQESATLELDSGRRVGDSTTGRYLVRYERDLVTIVPTNAGGNAPPLVTITYDPKVATWSMAVDHAYHAGPGDTVTLDEKRIDASPIILVASDEIGVGNGLRIRWNEPAIHACVFMTVDTARIRKLAHLGTLPITATVATLSTGFALARPGIRLTLPPIDANGSLVEYGIPEMMQKQDFDLYAVLDEVGGYLTDRRKIFAPPHNRVERVVSNVNNGLRNLDSIVTAIDGITSDASRYLSSPAALRARPGTRLDSLVADLNALKGIIAAARNDISIFGGKAGRAVDNIDRTTVPRVNSALDSLNSTMRQIDTLAARFDQLTITIRDTTLYRAEGSLKSVADDVNGMRDEVRRLVRSLNTLVIQLR